MKIIICGLATILLISSCKETASQNSAESSNMQMDSCDNPDASINCCFVNMPSSLTSSMKIADENEKGDKLHISGIVYKQDGKTPYPDVLIYAYHTDDNGYYSKKGNETGFQKWHGHLHGWCKTDKNGYYEIHSIRPAPYPDNSMPAHIHAAVKKPGDTMPYYINDFVFKDDPLVSERYISTLVNDVGGTGIVDIKKSSDGTWQGERNIVLTK